MTDPAPSSAPREPALAPLERSLTLDFAWRPNRHVWGATWAFVCGLMAATPWREGVAVLAALALSWFLAVPIWGRVWTDLAVRASAPRSDPDRRAALARLLPLRQNGLPGIALLLLALALVLEPLTLLPMMALALAWLLLVLGSWPWRDAAGGWLHGLSEIWCPALVAWLAAGGAMALELDRRMAAGNLSDLSLWWQQHGAVPIYFLAFAIVFRGAIGGSGSGTASGLRRTIVAGYLLALVVLAWAGNAIAFGLLAMLFVLQWPYQAGLAAGKLRWHYHATQGWVMLAMLVGAIGLGLGR